MPRRVSLEAAQPIARDAGRGGRSLHAVRELGMGPREYAMLHPLAPGKPTMVKHEA